MEENQWEGVSMSKKIGLVFISFFFFMNCQANEVDKVDKVDKADKVDEGMQSWFCLTHGKSGRMMKWNEHFVQWGERVYFDNSVDPELYIELRPFFSIRNKGPYQDPLELEHEDKKKYIYDYPYNITRTEDGITLKYLQSGQVLSLEEDPSGNIVRSRDTYKNIMSGEVDFVIEYNSFNINHVNEIHFDFSTKTLTETVYYKITEKTPWRKQHINKRKNGQIIPDAKVYLTPEENKELYHKMSKSFKESLKYVETATCKKDNAIKSRFRNFGNIFFFFIQ